MDPLKKNNVKIIGNPDGEKVLVFGHGFGSDQTAWRFVTEAFKNDCKIVLYDNIGTGSTDPKLFSPVRYNTLKTYTDDLLSIIEALNLRHVIYAGHSAGAMIGMHAVIKAPEYFSKMIYVGASPRYLNDDGYVGGFDQSDLDALFQAMTNNYYAWVSGFASTVMANQEKPGLAAEFAGTLSAVRPDIAVAVAKTIFQSDYRGDLDKPDKETLVVQATNDIAVPLQVGDYLCKRLKQSRLVRVNAEGHFPHISSPREIIEAIKNFI